MVTVFYFIYLSYNTCRSGFSMTSKGLAKLKKYGSATSLVSVYKSNALLIKKCTELLDFFYQTFQILKKIPMLTRDLCAIQRKDILSLKEGKVFLLMQG
jgi:hypothetical protein